MGCNSQAKSAKAVASTRDAPVVPLKGEDVAPGRVRRESLAALMVVPTLPNEGGGCMSQVNLLSPLFS